VHHLRDEVSRGVLHRRLASHEKHNQVIDDLLCVRVLAALEKKRDDVGSVRVILLLLVLNDLAQEAAERISVEEVVFIDSEKLLLSEVGAEHD